MQSRIRRPIALATMLFLLPAVQSSLFAQQDPYPGPQQPYAYSAQYDPGQQYQQPYAQPSGYAQSPGLGPDQLQQLVAPIALNPDPLVALMLAASTYPQQVTDADHWRQSQGNAPPDQIAYGADAQNWDPSIKALTAFPQVLAEMDQNLQWTAALGNAYYNQPQDVLEAVQIMRQRAQAAGNLQSTPEENVSYNQGNIQLMPANPQVVYVPAYNPWTVYGQPVAPYPGFSLLGALGSFFNSGLGSSAIQYGLGIVMSAFNHSPWGLLSWGLNWLSQNLLFHSSNYYSSSSAVADWGLPYGGPRAYMAPRRSFAGYNRGYGYGQNSLGYSRAYNRGYTGPRSAYNTGYNNMGARTSYNPRTNYNRGYQNSVYNYDRNSYNRSNYDRNSYDRNAWTRAQSNIRPAYDTHYNSNYRSNHGSFFTGREQSPFANRSALATTRSYNSYRAPSSSFNRNGFNQRSSAYTSGNYNHSSFTSSYSKPSHSSGGFHLFGNSHNSSSAFGHQQSFKAPKYKAPKAYKAPKMHSSGGGHHSFSGGSHHSSSHHH